MSTNITYIRKKFLKKQLSKTSKRFAINTINKLLDTKYVYHFNWFGIPTIQFPSDLIVLQELIFKEKPKIIIETGIAHGGTIIFYASILKLLYEKNFKVIGLDIKIKKKNIKNIKKNKLSKFIKLIEISSTDKKVPNLIKRDINNKKTLVVLDSNHTHDHVLNELNLYSNLIKKNDFIVVMDTAAEFVNKKHINKNRDFKKGNSPHTAVKIFLKENKNFKIEKEYEAKSLITGCFDGFLRKIRD